jgi:hypothetical protein
MKNVFASNDCAELIRRIDSLSPATSPRWGKMSAAQMLAHCNVTYELVYTQKHPKPNFFVKWLLRVMVKGGVVNEKPYAKSKMTAPMFIITGDKDFVAEKSRLIEYINQTQALGREHFAGKESHSFGVLSAQEWNNMFYKHLDHHLQQFGV